MKLFYALTLLVFMFGHTTQAQSKIIVNEILQSMERGEQTGFEVLIPEATSDDVKNEFGKYLKKHKAKVSSSKKSNDGFGDNANFTEVSSNTVDVYYSVLPMDNGSRLNVFVDLGGAFISSSEHEAAYNGMEVVLKEFGNEIAHETIEEQIKVEEKQLKNLEGELEDLVKDKEGYIKDIEEAKALINQREEDIVNNEENQEKKDAQIDIQREIIETIKAKLRHFE